MTTPAVHLTALSAGWMTSALGGFLEGEHGSITFPVPFYVIEHPMGLTVVDTGLHPQLAQDTTRLGGLADLFTPDLPEDGSGSVGPQLRAAGFDPDQVVQVILTHLHFDHAGGLIELPNARILVQRREWAQLTDGGSLEAAGINPDDVELGHDRFEADGDVDVYGDGTVDCLVTPGHTPGHQSVRVRTPDQTYLICGDCAYLERSLVHEHLPPFGFDRDEQVRSIRRLAAEQAAGCRLLYGHDPDQWARIQRDGLLDGA
ncbi:MAG: N-acyl homoserine lactonase family protein [Acidimicrobiales bacterium]